MDEPESVQSGLRPGLPASTAPILSNFDVAMQFESLGGSGHGCEFGLFQRHFSAEPLGLLRWADLAPDLLIRALETRLDGVGQIENTIIFIPDGSDEWWTRDTRYWMAMRSFVKTADVDQERMTKQVCRRLVFLRRKLINDLEAGEKIFVYKNMVRNLTEAELNRLHAAVRAYGDSTLFYVRYADETHPAGTVEATEPGLLIGYIDHFAYSPEDKPMGPANHAWLALCERAYRLWKNVPADAPGNPDVPAASGRAKPARGRRVVLIGNCQMQAMTQLYKRFVAGRTGDILHHVQSYQDLTPEGLAAIEQADVVVEQLFDVKPQADTSAVTTSTPRLFIPMVTAAFLWPFASRPHPKNRDYPFLQGGPYGGEASDSYLNRLILAGTDPEEAVEAYANLDVKGRVNLDRLYELVMDRQRSRDKASGYQIADIIERHFRTEQIFLSPYHPNVRVAVALAARFFEQLGAEPDEIERMRQCTRITPFPKGELPLHPAVCRHFGLTFVGPDRRYRFMNEGLFTFREYAMRYMRYEWNDALEEGISLTHASQFSSARELLTSGLERSPNSAAGHNALSHVLNQMGAHEEAIAEARQAVAIELDSAAYHANLGNMLRSAGHLDEAEVELRAAVSADPVDPHYLVLLAHLARQIGSIREGVSLIRQAVGLDPHSTKLRMELATFLAASEDADSSSAMLRELVALEPDNAEAHSRLAQALGRLNLLDDAVDSARTAVRLDPNATRFRIVLSDLLLRQDRQIEALTEAYAAAVGDPASGHAYGHLGHALRLAGDLPAAEMAFRHAAKLEPRNAHVRHELSVMLKEQQRFDDAIVAAKEAAEAEPRNPNRFVHLASLYVTRNDLSEAQAAQGQAVKLAPGTVSYRVVLSDLFARGGRWNDALTEARLAVEDFPNSAHALGHLAHIVDTMGDFDAAEPLMRRALAIEPQNDHLRHRFEVMQRRRAKIESA
jgi:tetratricopeptide (TPR) repeat protein